MTTSTDERNNDSITAAPDRAGPQPAPSSKQAKKRRVWLRWVIAIILTLALLIGMIISMGRTELLSNIPDDPRNRTRLGSSVLATLLRDEGVDVTVTEGPTAPHVDRGSTLVISSEDRLAKTQITEAFEQRPARIILLGDSVRLSRLLGLPATYTAPDDADRAEPGCDLPLARAVGWVRPGAVIVPPSTDDRLVAKCFGDDVAGYLLLEYTVSGVVVDLLAGGVSNGELGTEPGEPSRGNAALGMRLFGQDTSLSWWIPRSLQSTDDSDDNDYLDSDDRILPNWVGLALIAGLPFIIVVGVWRGRRFGPIITERLPVVVRASETVEGHGRMYHRLKAYDTAGMHLREGTIARLGRRFGTRDPDHLTGIVADRTRLPVHTVQQALSGAPPTTEAELLDLKQALARIEQEARS